MKRFAMQSNADQVKGWGTYVFLYLIYMGNLQYLICSWIIIWFRHGLVIQVTLQEGLICLATNKISSVADHCSN